MRHHWRPSRRILTPSNDLETLLETFKEFQDTVSGRVRIRRPEPDLPRDPAVWLESKKMTQTEVSLRLATYLLSRNLTRSDVRVALNGYELTRRERPRFPVLRYLSERGYTCADVDDEWRGSYLMKGAVHGLVLHSESEGADVVATMSNGQRLLAFVTRGLLGATRSPAEHKLLRGALARAATCELAQPGDLLAAAVPRSKRFRELAARWRDAEGTRRAGIAILTVDRAGLVEGFSTDRTI